MLSHLLMVVAGAVCFGAACALRTPIGFVTSGVMLFAMADHAFGWGGSSMVWAALLIVCGIVHGVRLRLLHARGRAVVVGARLRLGACDASRIAGVGTAVSFPLMAWVMLVSAVPVAAPVTGALTVRPEVGGHSHQRQLGLMEVGVGVVIVLVALLFLGCAIREMRGRNTVKSIDMSGMAAMMGGAVISL